MRETLRKWVPTRERTRAATFVTMWLVALLLVYGSLVAIAPKPALPGVPVHARLVVRGPSWTIDYAATTRNATVFLFLREAGANDGFELRWVDYTFPYRDVFITSINGTQNDQGRGVWWQYCVNDVYASVGAANQEVHDGDVVTWVYAHQGGSELCR